jgi:argininosuccinate synthase
VAIDHRRLGPAELLRAANEIGGGNGLGLYDVVESRVNGTKCRGVYEAPGMELLSHAVRAAYETVTDRAAGDVLRSLSRQLAVCVYEGNALAPAAESARAGIDRLARFASASVQLDVYKGGVLGRALLDFDAGAGVVQQRRFAGNGHNWSSAPISPAP